MKKQDDHRKPSSEQGMESESVKESISESVKSSKHQNVNTAQASYAQNKSSSKEKKTEQRLGVTEEVEEVSGIRMGNARIPKYLVVSYVILGIWAFFYAFTAQPLNERIGDERVVSGQEIFQRSCAGCHGIHEAKSGPALAGVSDRYSDEEIHQLLMNGRGAMPALPNLGLNTQQIKAVEDYIKQLK